MATPGLVADLPRGYSVRSDQASHPRAVEILRSFASRYQTQKHSGFPEAQSTFWRTRPRADDEQEKEMDRSATDTTKLGVLEEVSRFENVRYGPARFVNTRSTPQAQLVFLSPTLAKVSVCISFRGQHPSWTETDAEKIERQKQSSAYSRKLEATLLRQSAVCGSTCCLDYEAMKKP
ncbi:hypothetical protein LTR09_011583 [Extremus antarcticus]|uniref:Uncharacterized protein n=1 Tax=Extremus antarcticus TaxID=702011 RepID=A0AAJ0DC30_9PEZI|nr:hypothetical protein LTR09_011583 [Extremus antarcticus]